MTDIEARVWVLRFKKFHVDTYLTFGQKLENPSTVQCKRRPREYTRGGLNSGVATGLGFKKRKW